MREHLQTFRRLMRANSLDVAAVAMTLDEIREDPGQEAEIAVVIDQARRSIAAVRRGDKRFRPLLRHAIGRLIALLEKRSEAEAP